jgi:pimeloyl-ACP methyl ester carboxylesterase
MMPFEANTDKPTIVLIHGAWADGSCWREVIPFLQKSGHKVVAAQLPLANFAEDVSFAKRVIEGQKGQVVVVGHSYGGAVITEAATDNANVKALVFIAAFSPDVGESLKSMQAGYAQMPIGDAIVPAAAGFLYLDPAKFHSVMAHDLPESQAAVLAAVQIPLFGASFATPIKNVAWKTIPSWFLISTADRAIDPDQQRFGAERMGARVFEVDAGHLPMLSKPKEVAEIIEAAVKWERASTVGVGVG